MARKSRLDVIKKNFGGKWVYDQHNRFIWNCSDGRSIVRQRNCNCWAFNDGVCDCKIAYMMRDGSKIYEVDINDPKIYELNGAFSVPLKYRTPNPAGYGKRRIPRNG
jgi:hypothetical protein